MSLFYSASFVGHLVARDVFCDVMTKNFSHETKRFCIYLSFLFLCPYKSCLIHITVVTSRRPVTKVMGKLSFFC